MQENIVDDGDGLPINFQKASGGYTDLIDFSLDPYAGASWGSKPIWSAEQAMANLLRTGVSWNVGNSSGLDEDGVLTFGFWPSLEAAQNSYYLETDEDGYVIHSDSVQIYNGNFAVFTPEQMEAARGTIQLWDDLIAITFREAPIEEADVTFGFVQMSPAAGAHAFYPQEDALNAYYGYQEAGRISGDVWLNYQYSGNVEGSPNIFADMSIGSYGWFTLAHELGHSLGLPHGGQYNASYDGDGDGVPDPITYGTHAYFAQDTQQYTIMSYFDGSYTGQNAFRWNNSTGGTWMMAQTPQVHDILAAQALYGADYTTRSGDTVYGFNSTADRDVFDFTKNDTPIVTIWDGGGNDTLDLSGFASDAIIDINEGAFSSAGHGINAELKAILIANGWTDEDFAALYESWGLGPDGQPVDNIAIAYGAKIENAIGGSGNDRIIGNDLNNVIKGGDGIDVISLGAGSDTFTAEITGTKSNLKSGTMSVDIITDFTRGQDKIDVGDLGSFIFGAAGKDKTADTITFKTYESVNGAENALGFDIDGQSGAGVSGPVTVVYVNQDGGAVDAAIILLNTSSVNASDFYLS